LLLPQGNETYGFFPLAPCLPSPVPPSVYYPWAELWSFAGPLKGQRFASLWEPDPQTVPDPWCGYYDPYCSYFGGFYFYSIRIFFIIRHCDCTQITPYPISPLPGVVQRRCAMECTCSDGSFGIGLYTVTQLKPVCGATAEYECPKRITTISMGGFFEPLIFPVIFTSPTIIACTPF